MHKTQTLLENHRHFPCTTFTRPWTTGNRYLTWARKTLAIHSIWVCKLSQHRCLQSKMYDYTNQNVHSPVYLVINWSEIPLVSLTDGLMQSKWEYLSTGCLVYDVRIMVYKCYFKQNIAKVLIIAERQSAIFLERQKGQPHLLFQVQDGKTFFPLETPSLRRKMCAYFLNSRFFKRLRQSPSLWL